MPGVLLQEGRPVATLLQLALKHHLAPALVHRALALLEPDTGTPPLSPPEPAALPGGETLSPRELEVLRLVAAGLTNQEIADQLVIAPGTAKRHTINIYGKLGVNNRTQAVAKARELKLL
jgi:LuxR family maltose regulon positive regulatory protein